ncbi:hypothetical protein ACMAZF_14910 [Psychrobium sp. nBUS_13]|uniref:hypothetical protein n=1 Tax=Psychrobium sp. nBUS_13 TaxID=3395319 RepID=UPI003EB91CB1
MIFRKLSLTQNVERPPDKSSIILSGRDRILSTLECKHESKFFCFFSIRYAFAVPKKLSSQKEWTVENVNFRVVDDKISLLFLGHRYKNLYLIQTPASGTLVGKRTGNSTFWLYSPKYGLLGFGEKRYYIDYWLQQEKGFGHKR